MQRSLNTCCNSHSPHICRSHFFYLIPVFSSSVHICRVPALRLQIANTSNQEQVSTSSIAPVKRGSSCYLLWSPSLAAQPSTARPQLLSRPCHTAERLTEEGRGTQRDLFCPALPEVPYSPSLSHRFPSRQNTHVYVPVLPGFAVTSLNSAPACPPCCCPC